MKVTIDTKENEVVKISGNPIEEVSDDTKEQIATAIRNFIRNYTTLTDYENDCMWMSYRYCIGRHTIAADMHAGDIWKNCKGRLSKDKQLFTAFDINREIEQAMAFVKPNFHFPLTSLNRIYTTAIDIFCEFLIDYDIKSIEDLIKYRDVHVILTDNERGYKFETVTWDEYFIDKVKDFITKRYDVDVSNETAEEEWNAWLNKDEGINEENAEYFKKLLDEKPDIRHYWLFEVEDLFVWNNLAHCFDWEHHHKSVLKDGSEREWFWTWTKNCEYDENGRGQFKFGYHKVRAILDKWNGSTLSWIPDEAIEKDLY